MAFDDIVAEIGQFGRWQCFTFILCSLCCVGEALMTFLFNFVGYTPKFRCFVEACDGGIASAVYDAEFTSFVIPVIDGSSHHDLEGCIRHPWINESSLEEQTQITCKPENVDMARTKTCDIHVYDTSVYERSIVREFDWAPCGNSFDTNWSIKGYLLDRSTAVAMTYMLGMLIGGVFFGILSDRIGRKPVLITSLFITSASSLAGAFASDFWSYLILRLITGLGSRAVFMMAFIITVEMSSQKNRTQMVSFLNVGYSVGELILGMLAYGLQNWSMLQMVVSLMLAPLLGISFVWFIESPRWLIAKGETEKAAAFLKKAAKLNRKKRHIDKMIQDDCDYGAKLVQNTKVSASKTAKTILILCYVFIASTLCHHGLIWSSFRGEGKHIYLNSFLLSFTDIPACILIYLTVDKVGRRVVSCALLLLSAAAACTGGVIDEYVEHDFLLNVIFSLIAYFGTSAALVVNYLQCVEVFPTKIRGTSLGIVSGCGRFGGLIAPLMANLDMTISYSTYAGACAVAAFLIIFLPETLGTRLPETQKELNYFYTHPPIQWFEYINQNKLLDIQNHFAQLTRSQEEKRRKKAVCNMPYKENEGIEIEATSSSQAVAKPSKFQIPEIIVISATPIPSIRKKMNGPLQNSQQKSSKNDELADVTSRIDVLETNASISNGPRDDAVYNNIRSVNAELYPNYQKLRRLSEDTNLFQESHRNAREENIVPAELSTPPTGSERLEGAQEQQFANEVAITLDMLDKAMRDNNNDDTDAKEKENYARHDFNGSQINNSEHEATQLPDTYEQTIQFSDNPSSKAVELLPIDGDKKPITPMMPDGHTTSVLSLPIGTSSRKFSQLSPAPTDSPLATKVGNKFTMIPTEEAAKVKKG